MSSEQRQPIICNYCGTEMVFSKEVLRASRGNIIYLKYVCPRRMGEAGCGAVKRVYFKREPRVRFGRTRNNTFVRI